MSNREGGITPSKKLFDINKTFNEKKLDIQLGIAPVTRLLDMSSIVKSTKVRKPTPIFHVKKLLSILNTDNEVKFVRLRRNGR